MSSSGPRASLVRNGGFKGNCSELSGRNKVASQPRNSNASIPHSARIRPICHRGEYHAPGFAAVHCREPRRSRHAMSDGLTLPHRRPSWPSKSDRLCQSWFFGQSTKAPTFRSTLMSASWTYMFPCGSTSHATTLVATSSLYGACIRSQPVDASHGDAPDDLTIDREFSEGFQANCSSESRSIARTKLV